MSKKAFKLSGISLDEVSLVDIPASQRATIALLKRGKDLDMADMTDAQKKRVKEYLEKGYSQEDAEILAVKKGDGDVLSIEELVDALEALEKANEDLTKRADDADAKAEAIEKAADAAGFDFDGTELTKRADVEYIEIDGEKIEKSAVPAAILKRMEAQDAELAKAKKESEEAELAKRGEEELPTLPGTALAKGKLVAAADEDMLKTLKAADAALKKQLEEIGSNPLADEGSASFKLDKMARDHASEHGVPFETAFAEVTKTAEGQDLMVKARAEAN